MKFRLFSALTAAVLLASPAFATGKAPKNQKACETAKNKKAGWVWENEQCVKKTGTTASKKTTTKETTTEEKTEAAPAEGTETEVTE